MLSSDRLLILLDQQADLDLRLERVEQDRRRAQGPLSADSEERALEVENDEILDRLASSLHESRDAVNHALDRLRAGLGEECEVCGQPIGSARLSAAPAATRCRSCVQDAPSAMRAGMSLERTSP